MIRTSPPATLRTALATRHPLPAARYLANTRPRRDRNENNFAHASHFSVHFFAVFARMRREDA